MKTAIVIPARYKSTRFPGKPLKKIFNKEMIIWVSEKCKKVFGKDSVYVATDNYQIFNKVRKYGFKGIFTSNSCLTGTDRVAEASRKIKSKIYINVQGDEPLIKPLDIKKVFEAKKKYPNHVICGYTEILKNENPLNKNIPKVVLNDKNELVYMSRSLVPGSKTKKTKKFKYLKQVCIYAFNKQELELFYGLKKKSNLEKVEDIEILRFFELNKKIKMIKTNNKSIAVDLKSDIKKVESYLRNAKKN